MLLTSVQLIICKGWESKHDLDDLSLSVAAWKRDSHNKKYTNPKEEWPL